MIYYGKRIIYDKNTGKVLNGTFEEMEGELESNLRPLEIDFMDLPYSDTTLLNVEQYHIENKKIIIDKYKENILSEEEKLRLENKELENQLLLATDSQVGGIL